MNIFNRYKTSSDEALMQYFQEGKTAAFNELYRRYSKRILHFMYRMLNNDEERAQDLLQDLFLKIVERPEMFDVKRNFKSWVFTVAANLCRNEYRAPIFVQIEDDLTAAVNENYDKLIAQLDNAVFKKQLKKELNKLKYEHKATFILRFQEKLSIKEVGEIMGCSTGTVKSRIHYTIRKLAVKLEVYNPIKTS